MVAVIAKHVAHLRQSGDWAARDRARFGSEMESLLHEALMERFMKTSTTKISRDGRESSEQEHFAI